MAGDGPEPRPKKKKTGAKAGAAAGEGGGDAAEARRPFDDMQPALLPQTLATLRANGFTLATPVQEAVIPHFLSRKDVVVQACTGSGKTLAFLVPLFEILARRAEPLKPRQVGAIVIEPTRELATQVCAVAALFLHGYERPLSLLPLVGGTRPEEDLQALRTSGCALIVGTPGRIDDSLDRLRAEGLDVRELELLVLDEADRLLDMGFEQVLNAILGRLPKQRRTGLFSATQTAQLLQLVRAGLRNPVKVDVQVVPLAAHAQPTPASLTNWYVATALEHKLAALVEFLAAHAAQRVIVYVLTCAAVDYLGDLLPLLPRLAGVPIRALHGKMAHAKRTAAYAWYRARCADTASGAGAVLLCTDVAARGLDIPEVEWIVQYDAPQDPDTYVHRVGRTARMGRAGSSLLFVTPEEEAYVHFLKVRRVPLQPRPAAPPAPATLAEAKRALVGDRALLDKAVRAFVAHVRAYREHQLKFVFEFKTLNLGALATSYALLKMPRMSELRSKQARELHLPRFVGGMGAADDADAAPPDHAAERVDLDAISYRDKGKEKARLEALADKRAKREADAGAAPRGVEHDKAAERAARRRKRKADRHAKAEAKHLAACGLAAPVGVPPRAGDGDGDDDDDDDDFAQEARLLKRFKKGKVSARELDRALGCGDDDDDDDDELVPGQGGDDADSSDDERGGRAGSRGAPAGGVAGKGGGRGAPPAKVVTPEQQKRLELLKLKRKRLAALRAAHWEPKAKATEAGAGLRRGIRG